MRFVTIALLTGLLAWCAFGTGDEGQYIRLGSSAESCTKLAAQPDASGHDPFSGLMRITCDLDGALLWMENYYRINTAVTLVDPSDRWMSRSRSARHKPGR